MTGGNFMKNQWKKNMIAAAVLVTVCAGIYLNWLYTEDAATSDLTDTLNAEKVMSDESLVLSEDMEALAAGEDLQTTASDYFAAVRLSRQQARDSALNLLQEAMSYADSTKASESSAQLEDIVQTALTEAQIESLIIAKGYTDCVAYMTNEGISVAVSAPEGGLQQTDVAVIADIVMSQSDYLLTDIRIVEVN
jgi:stage III sporulation protein AH